MLPPPPLEIWLRERIANVSVTGLRRKREGGIGFTISTSSLRWKSTIDRSTDPTHVPRFPMYRNFASELFEDEGEKGLGFCFSVASVGIVKVNGTSRPLVPYFFLSQST